MNSCWTVEFTDGSRTTVTAAYIEDGNGLVRLMDTDGKPVMVTPLPMIRSVTKDEPAPGITALLTGDEAEIAAAVAKGELSIDAARRQLGLKPFGMPATPAPRPWARGSKERQQVWWSNDTGIAPFTFAGFQDAWDKACVQAWDKDKARAEPGIVLPGFLWPGLASMINPVTRNVVPVRRVDAFPVIMPPPGMSAQPGTGGSPGELAGTLSGLMRDAAGDGSAAAMLDTPCYRYTVTVIANAKKASQDTTADEDGSSAAAPVPAGLDVNNRAAVFAKDHGSFSLHFDATGNPACPDYRPWTLTIGDGRAWGGLTAEDAIDAAAEDLGREPGEQPGGTPEPRDPQPGDPVLIHGTITSIREGTATVAVYRSDPVGQFVPVQCGALELDETTGDGGTPAEPDR